MKNGRKNGVERADLEPGVGPLTIVPAEEETTNGHSRGKRRQPLLPDLASVLEAVLFATDKPVTLEQLRYALPEAELEAIEATLVSMEARYAESGAGFRLYRLAGGFQLRTAPELHSYVERFLVGKRRSRLSRAALETLAAVAYRQPITRGDLEDLRGVDCGQVLHTLMERNLVATTGRSETLGRPLLYGTTDEFLSYFGLSSLSDLPSLEEFQSLLGDDPLQDPEIREALLSQGMWEEGDEAPAEAPSLSLVVSDQEDDAISFDPEKLETDDAAGDATGYGSNGHASNGHESNGHSTNGHGGNGYLVEGTSGNGHETNGHSSNGHESNGHESNGHASNGHATNGHQPNAEAGNGNGTSHHFTGEAFGDDTMEAGSLDEESSEASSSSSASQSVDDSTSP